MTNLFGSELLKFSLKNRKNIIRLFYFWYVCILVFLGVGIYAEATGQSASQTFYDLGVNSGELALLFLIVTSLPGMLRRFGFNYVWITVLMNFRRYFGISVFLLAFVHFMLVRFVLTQLNSLSLFEFFGLTAFCCLVPMFLTSNDWSMHKLGVWWYRLHQLMYLILWLVFFHVMLQDMWSIWSALIGVMAFLEVVSLIVAARKRAVSSMPLTSPNLSEQTIHRS